MIYFYREVLSHKNRLTYSISSSFFGVSSKRGLGETFFKKVAKCWDSILSKLRKNQLRNSSAEFRSENDLKTSKKYQICFDRVFFEAKKDTALNSAVTILDPRTVADSHEVFNMNYPQSMGFQPSVLLLDSPTDWSKKIEYLKQANFWLPEETRSFLWNPQVQITPAPTRPTQLELTIRVITMDRPESLQRMLNSLVAAHYLGDIVHIEFHIDRPAASKTDISKYLAVRKIVEDFKWTQGSMKVFPEEVNAGIFKMWVKPFVQKSKDPSKLEILMVLEDDMVVSPFFYQWAKKVLLFYSPDTSNLYGFTIQRQHSVLGIEKGGRYQLTYVDKRVHPSFPFYRYQLLSTWGQFFFPQHWNAFVKWGLEARQNKSFSPCIPYLFCNKWYLDRPQHIWSIWFNYYVYQTGIVNLYINYNHYNSELDYGLLINYRESGLHFVKDNRNNEYANAQLINESMALRLLPLDRYPLYNFFFHRVKSETVLKNQWRFTSNFGNRSCITNLKS